MRYKNLNASVQNLGVASLAKGFEPQHTESESAVLPLHNTAVCVFYLFARDTIPHPVRIIKYYFLKMQKKFLFRLIFRFAAGNSEKAFITRIYFYYQLRA